MKTIKIKAYTAKELQKKFPKGFVRAHEDYQKSVYEMGVSWGNEISDSLKAVLEFTDGVRLRDWSIDVDNRGSYVKINFSQDEAEDLSGARAQAWIENNLLYKLRIPWTAYGRVDKEHYLTYTIRAQLSKYAQYYRPGMIRPCPFTGVCFDDDFLQSLQKDIKAGCTIGEAFHSLADVAGRLLEKEWEHELSEENFLEMSEENEWLYRENGDQI